MRNYFCFLIILFSFQSFAFSKDHQRHIDSLIQVIDTTQNDSIRCRTYYKLGSFHFKKTRDFAKASTHLFNALELAEVNNLNILKANCYSTLSWMEDRKEDHYKALEYMKKACAIFKKSNNKTHIFKADYNLGGMYSYAKQFDKAEYHLKLALEKALTYEVDNWIFNSYMALGEMYHSAGKNELALFHFLKSSEVIYATLGTYGNGRIPYNIAEIYAEKGDFKNANIWIGRSLACVKRRDDLLLYKEYYYSHFKIKKLEGKSNEALASYEKYVVYKDSIFSQKVLTESNNAEKKYINDLNTLEKEKFETEKKLLATQQQQAEQQTRWMTLFIIMMMIALVIFIYRYKITQRKNKIIEEQKLEVDLKNREILDSIKYAKRIQSAILPDDNIMKQVLPDSFVFYKPKDIVAGDFYWIHYQNDVKNSLVLFSVADCTGHGVPGALVSVVCNNALNRSVKEHKLTQPSLILDETRQIVCEEFEKSQDDKVNDGMDIALCSLEKLENGNSLLQYSGAYNPLWIVKKNEIIEIKADRQPIGKFDNPLPYINHSYNLEKGDSIYIFSDGYSDQFGGEFGKKFNRKSLKMLILEIQDKPMQEQKKVLADKFEEWKGDYEQIDDVCLMGIRI